MMPSRVLKPFVLASALLFLGACASDNGDVVAASDTWTYATQRTQAGNTAGLRSPRGLRAPRLPRLARHPGRRTPGLPSGYSTNIQPVNLTLGRGVGSMSVDQFRFTYGQGGRVVHIAAPTPYGVYGTRPTGNSNPVYNPATGTWTYH